MKVSAAQRNFLEVLAEAGPCGLMLWQVSARMKSVMKQATATKLLNCGLIEFGEHRKCSITDAGRHALSQPSI